MFMDFAESSQLLCCWCLSKHVFVNIRLPKSLIAIFNSEQPRCMLIMSCFLPVCSKDYDNKSLFWRRSLQGLDERVTSVTTSLSLCFKLCRTTAISSSGPNVPVEVLNSGSQFVKKKTCVTAAAISHVAATVVDISRTFRVPMDSMPSVLMLLVLQRLARSRGTSCDSTYGLLRQAFLSLDVRLKIHVARTAVWEHVFWSRSATPWGHAHCFHGDSMFPLWLFAAPCASG